jgi:tetratricopeptide (TPR) repeat protein
MSGSSGGSRMASQAEADLQWAAAAISRGQPADAERLARNVLAAMPQHPRALYLLGCALLRQDRAAQAIAPLEKAARALQDPVVETELGMALRTIGRIDDALARLRRATKRRPVHARALHQLAFLLLALGHVEEAIAVLEHGIQLAPAAVELPLLLGVIQHDRREHAKAKAAFSKALATAPDHPDAHYGMASVMLDDAEHSQAAEHFRRSLAGNSGDAQTHLKLGVCLLELGHHDEAFDNIRSAIRIDANLYGLALKLVSTSARGRFWLRPSSAAKRLL